MHKLWGWQGSPRMALLLSWAQGSCPEASVAAAPSRRSADRASLAPGDPDVMLERFSGTKVPGNLTDTKYFLKLHPPPFPRSSSSKHAKYSPERSLLWPCQAQQSRGWPVRHSPGSQQACQPGYSLLTAPHRRASFDSLLVRKACLGR